MSNRRTQLKKIMRNAAWAPSFPDIEAMADAVLAAGWAPEIPATIDTVEDIDALPLDSILRDAHGNIYRRVTPSFFCWQQTSSPSRESGEVVHTRGPIELIYTPHVPTDD